MTVAREKHGVTCLRRDANQGMAFYSRLISYENETIARIWSALLVCSQRSWHGSSGATLRTAHVSVILLA